MQSNLTAEEKLDLLTESRNTASFLRRGVGGRETELIAADTIDILRHTGAKAKKLEWTPIVGDERSLICQVPELSSSYIIRFEEEEDLYCPSWDLHVPLSKTPEPLMEAAQDHFEKIVGALVQLVPMEINAELLSAADKLQEITVRIQADRDWRTNDNSLLSDMCDASESYETLRTMVEAAPQEPVAAPEEPEEESFKDELARLTDVVLGDGDQSALSKLVSRKLPSGWRCCVCNLEFLRVYDGDNQRVMPAELVQDQDWVDLIELAADLNKFFGLNAETIRSMEDRVSSAVTVEPCKKKVTDAHLEEAAGVIMAHPRGLDYLAQAIAFRVPYESSYTTARRAVNAMAGKGSELKSPHEELSEQVTQFVSLAKNMTVDTLEGELPPGWEVVMSKTGGIVVLDEDDVPQDRTTLDRKLKRALEMVDLLRDSLGFEDLEVKSRRQKSQPVTGMTP